MATRDRVKDKIRNTLEQELKLNRSNIFVFHRPNQRDFIKLGYLLKRRGWKIVMDNDDSFNLDFDHTISKMWRDSTKSDLSDKDKHKQICKIYNEFLTSFMGFSDMVLASTDFLAREYKTKTDYLKVKTMPNYLDVESWPVPKKNKDPKIVRIGFSGSTNRIQETKEIKGLLDEIMQRDDVKLVIQGFQSKKILKNNPRLREYIEPHIDYWKEYGNKVEFHDYVFPLRFPDTLNNMKMDMMLIPRSDNYFNRAKSNIKYLEASILKIPVVATGFLDGKSPYQKDIKDGENGFIAYDENDWRERIIALIEDKKLREQIGENAYDYVKKNYDWKDHWQEYEGYLNTLE